MTNQILLVVYGLVVGIFSYMALYENPPVKRSRKLAVFGVIVIWPISFPIILIAICMAMVSDSLKDTLK